MEILSYRLNDKFKNLVQGDLDEVDKSDLLERLKTFSGFIFIHGPATLMERILAEYESARPANVALCFLNSSVQVLPDSYQTLAPDLNGRVSDWLRAKYGVEIHSLTYPIPTPCLDASIRSAFARALEMIGERVGDFDAEWLISVWNLLDPYRQSLDFIRTLEVPIAAGPDPAAQDRIRKEFLPALAQFRWSSSDKYSELRSSYLQACRSLGKKNFS